MKNRIGDAEVSRRFIKGAYPRYFLCFAAVLAFAVCCTGCKKNTEKNIVGKWVYKIDLSEKETGLKDVKEGTIEFFTDNTFKTENIPAVIVESPSNRGKVTTGHGTWTIEDASAQIIKLEFLEIRGARTIFGTHLTITWQPINKIALMTEYNGEHVCLFWKVSP